jgi:adenine-specific DNA-methyltransferase
MVVKNKKNVSSKVVGQVFTPSYIAKFMVNNIVDILSNNSHENGENINFDELKVLEPASGRGVFLKYLLEKKFRNIKAYEIDFSLKRYLESNFPKISLVFEDFLGSKPEEKFDLIIGNPPYLGQNYNSSIFQELVQKYKVCEKYFVGNMDLFYYFIHHSIEKLNPGGLLSFITTNYWINKSAKTGVKLLKPHISEDCYFLQYIDLSNVNIFKDAKGQHNCIIVLQKKTPIQKRENIDKKISIHQYRADNDIYGKFNTQNLLQYESGLSNSDLCKSLSWNLLYPKEVKKVVKKIETLCRKNGRLTVLKDLFIIRNGLILIKDDIFILHKDKNLQVNNNDFFIKIGKIYKRINENEKRRLKHLYKGKSILPYSYCLDDSHDYLIYFNKDEGEEQTLPLDVHMRKNFPVLTEYLLLYESELKQTLLNAKENPKNFYFPRRGGYILRKNEKYGQEKIDLEAYYDEAPKIFFSYISNKNMFGYCSQQYYATSDTYFLWPKTSISNINYPFWLAYLNSKLVSFLFKAKNIRIKRSKTKVEDTLPIPDLCKFQSEQSQELISFIQSLSSFLIKLTNSENQIISESKKAIFSNLLHRYKEVSNNSYIQNFSSQQEINIKCILKIIDNLFFQLFNLDEEEIDYLITKYYYS